MKQYEIAIKEPNKNLEFQKIDESRHVIDVENEIFGAKTDLVTICHWPEEPYTYFIQMLVDGNGYGKGLEPNFRSPQNPDRRIAGTALFVKTKENLLEEKYEYDTFTAKDKEIIAAVAAGHGYEIRSSQDSGIGAILAAVAKSAGTYSDLRSAVSERYDA